MQSGQCMELVTGGSDMWIFIVFVCVTVTAIIIFVNYRRTKKTMDTIEEMLNVAVKGEFTEGQFDETRMSALETKFAHYLSASAICIIKNQNEKNNRTKNNIKQYRRKRSKYKRTGKSVKKCGSIPADRICS